LTDVVIIMCKYVMVVLMMCYTAGAFLALRYQNVKDMYRSYCLLNGLTFLLHGFGFLGIIAHEKDWSLLVFYGVQVVFMFMYLLVYRKIYKKANLALLSHMMMFLMLGFIILTRLDPKTAARQFMMVCIAAVIMLIVPAMFSKVKAARIWGAVTGVIGLFLLVVVLVFGKATYGANLSLQIGSIKIQPSEFVKISFVLLMAVLFRERHDVKRILFAGMITLAHVGVLVLSKDLGAAIIYAASFLMILYVVTKRPVILSIGVVVGSGAAVIAYQLFSHVQTRVQAWANPWPIFQNRGNQIGNSLFGIATGGWFGQGLYQGRPTKIPVVETDFVFAAICEEMGGIIGICIILICIACLLMFIHVAADLYLPFYRLTGIGLATIYGIQVVLNIGGVIKFIPSTGVTLPLVSYGGSSILSTFIMFGIMHELYIKRQNEVERIEKAKKQFSVPKRYQTGYAPSGEGREEI